MRRLAGAVILLVMVLAASDSFAEGSLEKRGQTLATRLCARCHSIGKHDPSQRAGAPAFRHLEQRVNLDTFGSRLRQGVMSGHHDMPEFRFSREDARALVAYLRSIQGR
jgi:mono/diheme cytochrome c family protein